MPLWGAVVGAFSKNHLRKWFNHETDSHLIAMFRLRNRIGILVFNIVCARVCLLIETLPRFFVKLYPHRLHISLGLINELTDIILFFMGGVFSPPLKVSFFCTPEQPQSQWLLTRTIIIDIASSQYSNAPFTEGNLKTILEITSKAKGMILACFIYINSSERSMLYLAETIGSTHSTAGTATALGEWCLLCCIQVPV